MDTFPLLLISQINSSLGRCAVTSNTKMKQFHFQFGNRTLDIRNQSFVVSRKFTKSRGISMQNCLRKMFLQKFYFFFSLSTTVLLVGNIIYNCYSSSFAIGCVDPFFILEFQILFSQILSVREEKKVTYHISVSVTENCESSHCWIKGISYAGSSRRSFSPISIKGRCAIPSSQTKAKKASMATRPLNNSRSCMFRFIESGAPCKILNGSQKQSPGKNASPMDSCCLTSCA